MIRGLELEFAEKPCWLHVDSFGLLGISRIQCPCAGKQIAADADGKGQGFWDLYEMADKREVRTGTTIL